MIRLVHQFDSPRTRAAAASPKSGGCSCCCCCCIATLIGSSVLTARSIGRHFEPRPVGETELDTASPDASPFRPQGPEVPVPNLRTIPQTRWKVLGVFLLPLSLLLPLPLTALHGGAELTVTSMFALYLGGLLLVRHKAGLRGYMFPVLLIGVPVFLVIEAIIWMLLILRK